MMLILDLQTLTEHFNLKFLSTNTTPVTRPPPPQAGFSFQISGRVGNGPPPQGGGLKGGNGVRKGGGMARDSVATNKLINNVYKRGLSWI